MQFNSNEFKCNQLHEDTCGKIFLSQLSMLTVQKLFCRAKTFLSESPCAVNAYVTKTRVLSSRTGIFCISKSCNLRFLTLKFDRNEDHLNRWKKNESIALYKRYENISAANAGINCSYFTYVQLCITGHLSQQQFKFHWYEITAVDVPFYMYILPSQLAQVIIFCLKLQSTKQLLYCYLTSATISFMIVI